MVWRCSEVSPPAASFLGAFPAHAVEFDESALGADEDFDGKSATDVDALAPGTGSQRNDVADVALVLYLAHGRVACGA